MNVCGVCKGSGCSYCDNMKQKEMDQIAHLQHINAVHLAEHKRLMDENSRLESYCRDYAEMTGITLNVPDEQREAFNAAISKQEKLCPECGDKHCDGQGNYVEDK